jgi:hypothetical protein
MDVIVFETKEWWKAAMHSCYLVLYSLMQYNSSSISFCPDFLLHFVDIQMASKTTVEDKANIVQYEVHQRIATITVGIA